MNTTNTEILLNLENHVNDIFLEYQNKEKIDCGDCPPDLTVKIHYLQEQLANMIHKTLSYQEKIAIQNKYNEQIEYIENYQKSDISKEVSVMNDDCELLAKSSGSYLNNGIQLIFDLYCLPNTNDDLLYLKITFEKDCLDTLPIYGSSCLIETMKDIIDFNNKHKCSYDINTINQYVKSFTNDPDALFEYNEGTGEYYGNCL